MDKATITHKGKEYTLGQHRLPKEGELFINSAGGIMPCMFDFENRGSERTILDPVVVEHVIGGVVFKEVDKDRRPCQGEWYLFAEDRSAARMDSGHSSFLATIVVPVRLVEVDDDDGCCRDS